MVKRNTHTSTHFNGETKEDIGRFFGSTAAWPVGNQPAKIDRDTHEMTPKLYRNIGNDKRYCVILHDRESLYDVSWIYTVVAQAVTIAFLAREDFMLFCVDAKDEKKKNGSSMGERANQPRISFCPIDTSRGDGSGGDFGCDQSGGGGGYSHLCVLFRPAGVCLSFSGSYDAHTSCDDREVLMALNKGNMLACRRGTP